ncbi:MAG: M20/M25/M40 family metallo-hydrolase [Acidobacteriota bacterium]|nr:M20/M25/M40 family metallo-hydrolase [Acidobacteriota bacterium]
MRLALASVALGVYCVGTAGCARSDGRFVTANARAHVNMLAETIGSRPAGSDANRRAREYLVDQLQIAGMEVRVQEVDARRPDLGIAGRVANIVAVRQGASADAIAIVAHYDSVADGPGAGDDAYGAAVAVETARVLAATPMRHSLMVLLTDGEESGLLGAAGAMADPATRDRIAAYLNIEAVGTSGAPFLFETGPGNRWLTSAWGRSAVAPRGSSFAVEIYRRTPNDTDFSILKRAGIPGLNFAITGDGTAYHTDRDTAARLPDSSLTAAGENATSVVTGLDALDLRQRTDQDAVYFDVAGARALSYGPVTAVVIGVTALLLGILAWLRSTMSAARTIGVARFLLTFIWSIAGAAAIVAAMTGAMWLLRVTREVYHPWYAQIGRAAAFMIASGIAAGWLVSRLGALIPVRARGERHPALVWAILLPVWILAAGCAMWFAPGAAHLATVPLLAAGLLLVATPLHSGTAVRIASVIVLAVAATIWLRHTIDLLFYANALLGRLPIVAPLWAFPALLAVAGLFVAPPLVAAATAGSQGMHRPSIFSAFCLIALAATGLAAYFGDAYSSAHPLRRFARYVQDDGTKTAMWEIGSIEPGLDLDPASGLSWSPDTSAPRTLPVARLPYPYRFTAPAQAAETPAFISATSAPAGDGIELTITVRPQDPSASVTLLLPPGITPARANLPGVISASNNRWRSTFVAPPADGVVWRIVMPADAQARLGETGVLIQTAQAPGTEDGNRLPSWMPRAMTAWHMRAIYVVPIGPLLIAPATPAPGTLPSGGVQ